ncbi:hypothetical protein SAMN05421805_101222 [Saccharopolyspora antimicrobica]|uniref:Uncharacterized protein n=1 Tax=Saccharopolyspora antimicrobica TaxID=455193 RepID=A0A1I4QRG2_9PSEU|nr:hypothetical protein [Saccharopolyspora antimicrobica]RKT88338.1 hypothetical protein ATL45_6771 [Saccharopolyspora antimicrobica]SFM42315.1 hypothetical protein SAMN05421805_101222 [Saccharopolyspora antimicrobica]
MSSTTSSSTAHRTTRRQPASKSRHEAPAIPVPYVTAELHTAKIPLPGGENVASAVDTVRHQLPSRDQLLFYGGLTAAAAFSVIEWPVAAAIGIGNALMQRSVHKETGKSSAHKEAGKS